MWPMCSTRRSRSMTAAPQVMWPGSVARLVGSSGPSRRADSPARASRSCGCRARYASVVVRMWERVGGMSSPRESAERDMGKPGGAAGAAMAAVRPGAVSVWLMRGPRSARRPRPR
ncbi:protein of unknown function [Streptomyces murinus]